MSITKNELWEAAGSQLHERFENHKRRPFAELVALIDNDEGGAMEVKGVKMALSSWAQKEEDGSVGVIVEVRWMRFLGWSQVRARGFFAFPDGRTKEMKDKDLWAHGY